eukprot:Pgem_evm1s11161
MFSSIIALVGLSTGQIFFSNAAPNVHLTQECQTNYMKTGGKKVFEARTFNAQECAELCARNAKCQYWDYKNSGTVDLSMCKLRKEGFEPRVDINYITGKRCLMAPQTPQVPTFNPTPQVPTRTIFNTIANTGSNWCFAIKGSKFESNDRVYLSTCDDTHSDYWVIKASYNARTKQIYLDQGNLCLDTKGKNEAQLYLGKCSSSDIGQKWAFTSFGEIRNIHYRVCIDNINGRFKFGNKIITHYCDNSREQQWNFSL